LGCVGWQACVEEANDRHLRLLRARSERPRSRAAEKRDELAPPHGRLRRRCCFRFLHLAFWVLLSFARDALVHL
jgi:hypothetical protein